MPRMVQKSRSANLATPLSSKMEGLYKNQPRQAPCPETFELGPFRGWRARNGGIDSPPIAPRRIIDLYKMYVQCVCD